MKQKNRRNAPASATAIAPAASGPVIVELPLADIAANPNQPRKRFDPVALKELADSIRQYGLIQPISVRPYTATAGATYQIIAGERRWRAVQSLASEGWERIPCIVRDVDDLTTQELALIENISRADMTLIETATAYRDLLALGFTVEQVAQRTGKSERVIQQHLDLLTIAPHLQALFENGRLRWSLAEELARLSPAGQEDACEHILSHDLGVMSSRRYILTIRNRERQIDMFPTTRTSSKEELDARARYDRAIQQITEALAALDADDLVPATLPTLESPFKETERIELMVKQLRRIQRTIEYAGHATDLTTDTASGGE